ncbi:hypothetical protein E2C01_051061 [Portunus trituberculatus]|uniref:Uncharacterized protein n=1 Tax=Portunus trituberculatus TaxID=210409 RepID=A0A5B7GJ65_PORTR|nr:hypothetical protein [Portunus trituberculatus]
MKSILPSPPPSEAFHHLHSLPAHTARTAPPPTQPPTAAPPPGVSVAPPRYHFLFIGRDLKLINDINTPGALHSRHTLDDFIHLFLSFLCFYFNILTRKTVCVRLKRDSKVCPSLALLLLEEEHSTNYDSVAPRRSARHARPL